MTDPHPSSTLADPRPLLLGAHWYKDDAGGLHRYQGDLFEALQAAGLHPRAVVAGPARDAPVGVVAGGHFRWPFPFRLTGYARAAHRTATTGINLVDAHFAFYAFWPVVAGTLRGLPLVVHFQGPWAQESAVAGGAQGWQIATKHLVEAAVYRRAREVVVLSDAFGRLLTERYAVPPWRVNVVPPGVDLARFTPGDRTVARSDLGLPLSSPVLLAVRRLVPRMGLDILLEAWDKVGEAFPDATLMIVGEGPDRPRLERRAGNAAIAGSVRFFGRVDDETAVRCYQAADVSVVPSVALEGFGLVVLESLACGTPPIVTDCGGLPEGVRPLDPTLVVDAANVDALAQRLLSALDGTLPLPDRDRCRAHAESHSWPTIAERHRVIYERAVRPVRSRLRVVYLDHCARLSGGELALLRLLPALDVDPHVILGEDGPLVEKLREAGVSVEVLALAGAAGSLGRHQVRPSRVPVSALFHTADYVARLAHRLRRFQPDLIHTNSLKSALYGGAAGRLASIPVIWHIRDRITDDYLPPAACRMVRAGARIIPAAIIANSRATLATLGRGGTRAVAIASPLGFRPAVTARRPTTTPLRVGMVGRLDSWKGQHVFLDAFGRAFPDGAEEAVIVGASLFGGNSYVQQLERQVESLGLAKRVEFRGFRAEIEGELDRFDVLVHASTIPEPFGQVVVEGMAAGLAVVASDAGGPAEVITTGRDGLLYPPGDVEALAHALQRLSADRHFGSRLGEAARTRALDFTAERIAPEVMALYRRVIAPAGDRSSP